ncbi:hypothetical protein WN982_00385 [Paraburkholderia sp. IMGN_8]|uniref:hypothetical protein n=1 Tax=Paraburkholderia sp. IMGN_8 TaxID=3136564 RepID=UPI00310167D0
MSKTSDEKKERFITESGLIHLAKDRRIRVTPDYLVSHLRDWTEEDLTQPVMERLIPFLEDKATRANDAAGARVMAAASHTKDAIRTGDAGRAAAYCALMICEALMAAYVPDSERAEMDMMDIKWGTKKAADNGIGVINRDLKKLEDMAVDWAAQIWRERPAERIGDVADKIGAKLMVCKSEGTNWPKNVKKEPTDQTIRDWLKKAAKDGRLTIPPEAQRAGAPKKK